MERRKFLKQSAVAATAAGSLFTGIHAPALGQTRKEMTIVSSWPRDFPGLGTSAQRLADRITQLSAGEIVTTYFAAGERIGAFDVFDDVSAGNSQAYISADFYWKGKHPAFVYFTTVPLGMTTVEWNTWIRFKDGQKLWDELSGQFGLKSLACGSTGTQMGGWFKNEVNSTDDLKGLKIRMPGLGGDVFAKLGASPVSLPGGQIYEGLASGTIDAAEWVGPYNDYFMKFYETTKYYYFPGLHEPGGGLSFGMNASWWGGLTAWEKSIISAACMEENTVQYLEAMAMNGLYLKRLVEEHGVLLRKFSDQIIEGFSEATSEVIGQIPDHSQLAARVHGSFQDSLREIGSWSKIAETSFSHLRNRVLDI